MYKNDILNELRWFGADIRTLTIIKKFFELNSKLTKQSLKDFCKNSNCFSEVQSKRACEDIERQVSKTYIEDWD